MRTLKALAIGAAMLLGSNFAASAAEVCYSYKVISGSLNCEVNNSNSGDFSSPCTTSAARVEKVQVACPVVTGNSGSGSGGGGGSSYGDNCACDQSSTGGWH